MCEVTSFLRAGITLPAKPGIGDTSDSDDLRRPELGTIKS